METNVRTGMKSKVIGTVLTVLGTTGLVYAAISQFMDGMDKRAAAGILLFSVLIVFIGIAQLYKKQSDQY
jgi:hypothetical protein